ncbi:MAG: carbohydrate ABC transporter permease [Clostridiales bacterium]|nr:carbohydrate ABC transporter permease [Clostridiales bacterium]
MSKVYGHRALSRFGAYAALALGAVMMVAPFAWMVATSLKTKAQLLTYPPVWLPNPPQWINYAAAIKAFPFFQYLLNNVKITGLIVLGVLATSSMGGFAFGRMRFKGRGALFMAILSVMMIPGQVTMVPVFLLVRDLGMIDSHSALIVPSLVSPFGVFLMRQYFLTLPRDLEDAAYVDGSSPLRTFAQIFLPLAQPALAALATLTFMGAWNSFMWPLILISTKSKQMLTVGLLQFQSQYSDATHQMMAATLMALAPIMLLYLFTQRYFIEGIAVSGIKG